MALSIRALRTQLKKRNSTVSSLLSLVYDTASTSKQGEYSSLLDLQTLQTQAHNSQQRIDDDSPASRIDGIPIAIKCNIAFDNSTTTGERVNEYANGAKRG